MSATCIIILVFVIINISLSLFTVGVADKEEMGEPLWGCSFFSLNKLNKN